MSYSGAHSESHQVGLGLEFAGFWIRSAAYLIDIAIVGMPIAIATGIWAVAKNQDPLTALLIIYVAIGLAIVVYFIWMWTTGATLGMRMLGLRVVDEATGQPVSLGRAALRYLGLIIAIVSCYIGLVWAAFDSRKQGLHDKIASTLVIRA